MGLRSLQPWIISAVHFLTGGRLAPKAATFLTILFILLSGVLSLCKIRLHYESRRCMWISDLLLRFFN